MKPVMGSLLAVGILIVAVGCESEVVVEHPQGDEAWEMAHRAEVDEEEVVARVDGQPITRGDVEEAWRHDPEKSTQEVLERLVEREILAQLAREEGYHERPEVAFSRKQGMVAALLADEVEAKAEPDWSRRDGFLEQVEQTRRAPEGLRASHLVVLVPNEIEDDEGETVRLRGDDREPYYEQGREYVKEALLRLDGQVDDDALRRVARELEEEVFDGDFDVAVDEHIRFPRAGESYDSDHLPRGWMGVVQDFAEGAESVATQERIGELSEPVRTRFGWHLIRVMEVIPERPVDADAAKAFVDHELRVRAQEEIFYEQLEQWADGVSYQIYPERLGSAFDESSR